MSLKLRFALIYMLLFSALLIGILLPIYLIFADFRQDEFKERLEQKANTSFRLLVKGGQLDENLMSAIHQNSILNTQEDKVFLYNRQDSLLYTNALRYKNPQFLYSLLQMAKEKNYTFEQDHLHEFYALAKDGYIIMVGANDKHGRRKLEFLGFLLLGGFWIGLVFTGVSAFYVANFMTRPIEKLNYEINKISESNLKARLEVSDNGDEISQMSSSFNQMLDRLESAFSLQKNFLQNASHELRTPLAALISQTESALAMSLEVEGYKQVLRSLLDDQKYLAQLTNSLLMLSKYENQQIKADFRSHRIDEILYKCMDVSNTIFANVRIDFEFVGELESEEQLIVSAHEFLLTAALRNLIKNACLYTEDDRISVKVEFIPHYIRILVENTGKQISEAEQKRLFMPFFRGKNSENRKGFGLGLAMSYRIALLHNGKLSYETPAESLNRFVIQIPSLSKF